VEPGPKFLDNRHLTVCIALAQARTADVPVMAAACGADAIYVDLEHSSTSLETTTLLCAGARSAGIAALVRVPAPDPTVLSRVLDGGATGVIVPHVESAEVARAVVNACHFPPRGHRSVYTAVPTIGYRSMSPGEAVAEMERSTIVALMVESCLGVEASAEIAGVEGVNLLIIGAYDLSAELGILGDFRHVRFREAVLGVLHACRSSSVVLGVAGIVDHDLLTEFVAEGIRFVSAGSDVTLFMQAARSRVGAIRSVPVPTSLECGPT
jgi:4-hydroxy-2-oxoheptanedioate aldolase